MNVPQNPHVPVYISSAVAANFSSYARCYINFSEYVDYVIMTVTANVNVSIRLQISALIVVILKFLMEIVTHF